MSSGQVARVCPPGWRRLQRRRPKQAALLRKRSKASFANPEKSAKRASALADGLVRLLTVLGAEDAATHFEEVEQYPARRIDDFDCLACDAEGAADKGDACGGQSG
jgi:hypothetical protein